VIQSTTTVSKPERRDTTAWNVAAHSANAQGSVQKYMNAMKVVFRRLSARDTIIDL
jgi:hypothetical protein